MNGDFVASLVANFVGVRFRGAVELPEFSVQGSGLGIGVAQGASKLQIPRPVPAGLNRPRPQ